ncbi:MAG: hypothetical protein U0350_47525 [Caldilineaceae bacterium]
MNSLTPVKTKTQESWQHLVDTAQQQSSEVQKWGVVAVSAVVGGLVVAAGAKGVLAIVSLIAAPPVALSAGALGGGALGWSYMQGKFKAAAENSTTDTLVNSNWAEAAAAS